jgi:CDP-glycerol glycerophosphotransferase (TagB/SpsB family)
LLFRWHINDLIESKSQELYDYTKISDRLILAGPDQYPDVQELLLKSSILITDYSTLMLDFLLLDRPILFFPYDYESYIRENGFYYDYNLFSPGPKIKSHSDFIMNLEKFLLNPQAGSKWRHRISDIMFPQKDGMSSERIMNKVKEIIDHD